MNVARTDFGCFNIFLPTINFRKYIYTNRIGLYDPVVNRPVYIFFPPLISTNQAQCHVLYATYYKGHVHVKTPNTDKMTPILWK